MGLLKNFDLKKYNCNIYVETGTGRGITLNKAHNCGFDKYYTVDIDQNIVNYAQKLFPTAIIECGLSTEILKRWLETEISPSDRVLFFLDAHFPGADYNGAEFDVNKDNAIPLKEELELIKNSCKANKYIIICDDARIYKNDNWEHGLYPYQLASGGIDFIYQLFDSQNIEIILEEEGYIIINML